MNNLINSENNQGPIFIVGMPRSGTTLMRSMLSVHPNIAVSRETHFFPQWWKRYRKIDLNNLDNFAAFWQEYSASDRFPKVVIDPPLVKEKILASGNIDLKTIFTCIMEVLAAKINKPRWAEKTPVHYKYLHILLDWYPQARIIWMLRDPRSVVASTLERWQKTPVDGCAEKWSASILDFQQRWSEDKRVRLIKYEDLVSDTESEMKNLCDFLGEKFYIDLISDRTQNVQQVFLHNENPEKGPNRLANQSITSTRIDRWRAILSPNQITTVESIAKDAMLRFNYQMQLSTLTY